MRVDLAGAVDGAPVDQAGVARIANVSRIRLYSVWALALSRSRVMNDSRAGVASAWSPVGRLADDALA